MNNMRDIKLVFLALAMLVKSQTASATIPAVIDTSSRDDRIANACSAENIFSVKAVQFRDTGIKVNDLVRNEKKSVKHLTMLNLSKLEAHISDINFVYAHTSLRYDEAGKMMQARCRARSASPNFYAAYTEEDFHPDPSRISMESVDGELAIH